MRHCLFLASLLAAGCGSNSGTVAQTQPRLKAASVPTPPEHTEQRAHPSPPLRKPHHQPLAGRCRHSVRQLTLVRGNPAMVDTAMVAIGCTISTGPSLT